MNVLYISVLLPAGADHHDPDTSAASVDEVDSTASLPSRRRGSAQVTQWIERPTIDMVVKQLKVHQAEGRICGKPVVCESMCVSAETVLEKAHLIQFVCYTEHSGEVVDRLM